jgi:hypothetical protein
MFRSAFLALLFFVAMPSTTEAKKKDSTKPIIDTLGGVTLGQTIVGRRGWTMKPGPSADTLLFLQRPQVFHREENTYEIQGAYRTNLQDVVIHSALYFTYQHQAQCGSEFSEAFAGFARAHDKPLEAGGRIVRWPTAAGHTLTWVNQCHLDQPRFEIYLQ